MMFLLLFLVGLAVCDDYVHSPIQYHSQTDRGSYNFGYDTGLSGAHQFHQESKDDSGVVRGRYGYTDPNGKLRLVYYSSGSNGFQAWGPDVPSSDSSSSSVSSSSQSAALKAPYEDSSAATKVSSRYITYPQSPAARSAALKSAKIVAPSKVQLPAKTVIREQVVTKTHYSPADQFRARYTSNVATKTAPIKRPEVKGAPVVVQQQARQVFYSPATKSAAIKGNGNRAFPITPAQYRSNYPPAGKYSRCYCE